MPETNERFRKLLKQAVGRKAQAEFAREAGISAAHLSRLITGAVPAAPSKETLAKIAAATETTVTLNDLMKACGYDTDPKRSDLPLKARVSANAKDIAKGLSEMIKTGLLWDGDAADLLDMTATLYSVEKWTIKTEKERDYRGKLHIGAEKAVPAVIAWEDSRYRNETWVILYTVPSASGKTYFTGWAMDVQSIEETFGMPHGLEVDIDCGEISEEEAVALPYYSMTTIKERLKPQKEKGSAEERLIDEIFRYQSSPQYPFTILGFGFILDKAPDGIYGFLLNHAEAWVKKDSDKEALEKIRAGRGIPDDEREDLDGIFSYKKASHGWGCAVAEVMRGETGLLFEFLLASEERYAFNRDCVIVDMDETDKKTADLAEIVEKYAGELRIPRFGTIQYTADLVPDSIQYMRSEDGGYHKVDERPEGLRKWFTLFPQAPDRDGLFRVSMENGTIRNMFYDSGRDVWFDSYGPHSTDTMAGWRMLVPEQREKKDKEDR